MPLRKFCGALLHPACTQLHIVSLLVRRSAPTTFMNLPLRPGAFSV